MLDLYVLESILTIVMYLVDFALLLRLAAEHHGSRSRIHTSDLGMGSGLCFRPGMYFARRVYQPHVRPLPSHFVHLIIQSLILT
jgi:hypothetical protein